MLLNILHRPSYGERFRFFQMQQDWAHDLGLKVTVLVQYPAMLDARIVEAVKQSAAEHGDEIGMSLADLGGSKFEEQIGDDLFAIWLYDRGKKRRIIQLVLDQFRQTFGFDPVSVAAYHLDAVSLGLLKELCPSAQIAVAGCFEEGVRVFHGCNNSWYLFNEGMPWGPWYPSKDHSLRPASSEEDAVGIIAVPHLSRDLALSYEGRNDFWASHPGNAMRGLANVGDQCPYDLNLVDMYLSQEKYNDGFSYFNVFVGANWLTHSVNIEDPPEVAQKLHREQYEYLAQLRDDGRVTDMTMAGFADWYRANHPVGTPEVYHAKEMLYGAGKQYFWYIDPDLRVLVDTTQGGSIGDLRPYAARVSGFTGPDSPMLAIGSYPYLIQSQHRTGAPNHAYDGARTTVEVVHGDQTVDLCYCPTKVAAIERGEGGSLVRLTPAELEFADGMTALLETTYRFPGDGRILATRTLTRVSKPGLALRLREYVKACYGYTEYPEDLHGIQLSVEGAETRSLVYDYQSRSLVSTDATAAVARVPQINTELRLEATAGPAELGGAAEGNLFNPYFTLTLEKTLKSGESFETCLRVSKKA